MCTLHEDIFKCMIISRRLYRKMRNVLDYVVEKIKTHVSYSIAFFRNSCLLWDNVENYGRAGQATDYSIKRRVRFGRWITKATGTYLECVVLLAFPGIIPVLWVYKIRPRVSQNSVRDAKCPGFFQISKYEVPDKAFEQFYIPRLGRNICRCRTPISRSLAGRNRRRREKCVGWRLYRLDWNCEGWGTDI
jgi:hypothetical protein